MSQESARQSGPRRPIAVVGPTASGKSALGLALAHRLDGEIVNIDAMQLYRGMDIGTAKLTVTEREGITHHQLDVLDVRDTATVASYQSAARADVEDILARGRTPIVVGGSMMYVQALLDDWLFPATDAAVRAVYEARLEAEGVAALHALLAQRDPAAAASILPSDGRRIVRALEVGELTGQPFAASAPVIGEPRWNAVLIGVDQDTATLDERIARRTELMFDRGFVDEVIGLVERGLREGVTAPRAIGYAQVLELLAGEGTVADAQERTCMATRRYVRRQRSWFRRDQRITWVDGGDQAAALDAALAAQS